MKTFIRLTLATILLAAASQGLAMMGIRFISPAKANELGIIVRAEARGTNQVWVQMEFKAEGELKEFQRVSLEIRDGEKLLFGWSALEAKQSELGSIKVASFFVDRAFLDKVTLQIVAGPPMNYSGNELRLKDFVDLTNLNPTASDKKDGAKADVSTPPPASPAASAR